MKITDVFEEKHADYIQDLISNEKYEHIRLLADHLVGLDDRQFAYDFDYILSRTLLFPVSGTDLDNNEIEEANELIFTYYLQYKIMRATYILEEYSEHSQETHKPISEELEETVDGYMWKEHFLYLKMKKIISKEALNSIQTTLKDLQKPKKKTFKATIEGKPLNNSERFQIVNQSLGLWEMIDSKEISQLKKYKLLALTLGINEDNARKLVSSSYDSKDRPELIEKYLKHLE